MAALDAVLAAIFITGALAAAAAPPAHACSPPDYGDSRPYVSEERITVPAEGIVALPARSFHNESIYAFRVETMEGAAVAGTMEKTVDRMIWRPARPLEPGAVYRGTLSDGAGDFNTFLIDVGPDPAPALTEAPSVTAVLGESVSAAQQLCCVSTEVTSCGPEKCWVRAWAYGRQLVLRWSAVPGLDPRYVVFRVRGPDGATVGDHRGWDNPLPESFESAIDLAARADRYCAALEVQDLVHGTAMTREICVDDDALIRAERLPVEDPDRSICVGPLFDRATRKIVVDPAIVQVGPGLGDGCAVGGGHGASGAIALVLAAALALRRRRLQ